MTQTARPSESTTESDSAASALSNWRAEAVMSIGSGEA